MLITYTPPTRVVFGEQRTRKFSAQVHSLLATQSLFIIIKPELSDISPAGRAPFGRIANPEGSPRGNDFQDIPKAQERIRGSLIIRDTRSNKPRPPPTGVCDGKYQLCKW